MAIPSIYSNLVSLAGLPDGTIRFDFSAFDEFDAHGRPVQTPPVASVTMQIDRAEEWAKLTMDTIAKIRDAQARIAEAAKQHGMITAAPLKVPAVPLNGAAAMSAAAT